MGTLTAFLPKRRGRIEQMDWMGKMAFCGTNRVTKNHADKIISIRCIRGKQMRFYASSRAGQDIF